MGQTKTKIFVVGVDLMGVKALSKKVSTKKYSFIGYLGVKGKCDWNHALKKKEAFSEIPPFTSYTRSKNDCVFYKKLEKYKHKRVNKHCIFCKYWKGISYDTVISDLRHIVGIIPVDPQEPPLPKRSRFADIDLV